MFGNGDHLGAVLSYFDIRQKDAAAAVGVDPAMVTRWKNGTERLAADSPRMSALVDYLLAPDRKLGEGDLRWLRSRFAEEDIDARFTTMEGLRDSLTNYLANDGSRVGQDRQERRQLYAQGQFAFEGAEAIVELARSELTKLEAGTVFYLVSASCGVELQPEFVVVVGEALRRGARLRLLVASSAPTGDDSSPDLITQTYLPLMTSPNAQTRFTPTGCDPLVPTAFASMLLIPGRLCLHASQPVSGAPVFACGIRQRAYVDATMRTLDERWAEAQSAFENPRETTPRVISGNMSRFYATTSGLSVASDGLNPLFMSPSAFERLLERKGLDYAERAWRTEAFERQQYELEGCFAHCAPYREMTTAVDSSRIRECGGVRVYGTTLVDARIVDVPTAIDILQGYLRFATLYPCVDLRFSNPSRELSGGLWMLSQSLGPDGQQSGLIYCQGDEKGVRQLLSTHPRVGAAVHELFEDAWGRFRFRLWHNGRLITSDDGPQSDPSLTVHFIREKIRELEELVSER